MADEVTVFKRLKWARRASGQDPILALGEVMIDHTAKEMRIGDGIKKFSELTDIVPLDVTQFGLEATGTLGGLKDDVKNGPAYVSNKYPLGTQIVVDWKSSDGTVYQCPWDIVNYQTVTLEGGTTSNAMIIQCHYALPVDTIEFDAPEPTNTDSNRKAYGSNRYMHSAVRQWLNSDANAGAWWTAQHSADAAPAYAATEPGFLAGFSTEFVELLSPVMVKTATANVDGNVVDTTYDKVWLPSKEELYSVVDTSNTSVNISGVEGPYWEYWKTRMGTSSPAADNDASNRANRITYFVGNPANASYVWLRSAYRVYSYTVWALSSNGNCDHSYAGNGNTCRVVPAAAILLGDDPAP